MSLISEMIKKTLKSYSDLKDTDRRLEHATAELNALQSEVANLNRNQGEYRVESKMNRQELLRYLQANHLNTIITFKDIVDSFGDTLFSLSKKVNLFVNMFDCDNKERDVDKVYVKKQAGKLPVAPKHEYSVVGLELSITNKDLFEEKIYSFETKLTCRAHNLDYRNEASYNTVQTWTAEQIMQMPICMNLFSYDTLFYFDLESMYAEQLAVIAQAIENKVEKQKTGGTTAE